MEKDKLPTNEDEESREPHMSQQQVQQVLGNQISDTSQTYDAASQITNAENNAEERSHWRPVAFFPLHHTIRGMVSQKNMYPFRCLVRDDITVGDFGDRLATDIKEHAIYQNHEVKVRFFVWNDNSSKMMKKEYFHWKEQIENRNKKREKKAGKRKLKKKISERRVIYRPGRGFRITAKKAVNKMAAVPEPPYLPDQGEYEYGLASESPEPQPEPPNYYMNVACLFNTDRIYLLPAKHRELNRLPMIYMSDMRENLKEPGTTFLTFEAAKPLIYLADDVVFRNLFSSRNPNHVIHLGFIVELD